MLSNAQILGVDDAHVLAVDGNDSLQRLEGKTLAAFYRLRQAAAADGIALTIASGHRDFFRQQKIWNNKATGKSVLRNIEGDVIPFEAMSSRELLAVIMRWSALPGASRHHWGSDFDVYDAAAVDDDYQLQLVPEEYQSTGVFSALTVWLDKQWREGKFTDFYRPYDIDRGGVAPEPWHLSYRPVAEICQQRLTPVLLTELLSKHDIALSALCLSDIEALYQRYISL
ncbi:hypothetical protein SIN8267_03471 [Sinobacterium norvegicum]|uniref:D-alanyl-D-alanine carboxypeptidase-like core domain-containing protein n=1 Tax=Sinobacterium norvegicum TaxID=1641715 RepID=A0ABM9AJW1_9GAMM|nr:M15 family metallopeptidase [Sinobacterium norvegicum]CAH0993323.1 hypothetical protein SIN8267_03471 [Sinobacterium norvegicum]